MAIVMPAQQAIAPQANAGFVSAGLQSSDNALNSYIIPDRDLSLDDRNALRRQARNALAYAAVGAGIGIVADASGLTVRTLEPTTDLGSAGSNLFLTAGLTAGTELAWPARADVRARTRSHTSTAPSALPVTAVVPSGVTATFQKQPQRVGPVNVACSRPEVRSHTRSVPS